MRSVPTAVATASDVVQTAGGLVSKAIYPSTFGPLINHLSIFVSLVSALGEVHPYAKMAAIIITSVFVYQRDRDNAVKDLLEEMIRTYAFVNDCARVLDLDERRKQLLRDLSRQTVECAYFIRDYANVKSFWKRAVKNALPPSSTQGQVDAYKTFFVTFRRHLTEQGVMETEIRVLRTLADVENVDLLNLVHVRGAGLTSAKACLLGTRTKLLDELSTWVNDPNGATVRFLVGVAGTGKSSIAHSLGSRFEGLRRLGCFFAFDRNFQGERHPESVLSTIAYELAGWNPDFKHALAAVLREKSSLSHTTDIMAQWDGLITEPAKKITFIGPVLIVVDAFDESISIDQQSRRLLLDCLSGGAAALPHNFRILITSRPEDDIRRVLRDKPMLIDSVDISSGDEDLAGDINTYVQHSLKPLDPDDDPLDEAQLSQIVQKAEGLFQWAATVCRVLVENPAGSPLSERFERRIGAVIHGSDSSLDSLYSSVLHGIFPSSDQAVILRFRSVMAQILCASQPLSIHTLQSIRSSATVGKKGDVLVVVRYMGALLSGISDPTSPIRPLHTSFRDFLIESSRSGTWHVSLEEGHPTMCLGLTISLNQGLRFNIFGLDTSYQPNSKIPDLQDRVSSSMFYAAGFLRDHIPVQVLHPFQNIENTLPSLVELFSKKLLLWLELLSVLGFVSTAPSVLQRVEALLPVKHDNTRVAIQDAIRFVRRFAYPISQSAPHIYTSALPFTPATSVTRSFYSLIFPHIPKISGVSRHWSRTQAVIATSSPVYAVSCSPDGRHLASGLVNSAIRIWDADTGEAIGSPFHGHSDTIRSIAYSHNGDYIVSGGDDGSVRIWDSITGKAACKPIQGHSGSVYTVLFSPDDKQVLSASSDCTLRIWNAVTGESIGEPIRSTSPVWAAAHSPDDSLIAFGSYDGSVRIYDVTARKVVGEPLCGHSASVTSVAYSPDGSRIVSCSVDSTARIWDAHSGKALGKPLHGHSSLVRSAAFSPDGHYIATCSSDSTARIWDAETGKPVGRPLRDHSGAVYSIVYTPDGRHIVSGSDDETVRIWNAQDIDEDVGEGSDVRTAVHSVAYSSDGRRVASGHSEGTICMWDPRTGDAIGVPLPGHSAAVLALACSPDGHHLISGSSDRTARIWDTESRQGVGEPLRGHTDSVYSVAYSPDGRRIATASGDSTIRIWDASTGQPIGNPLRGHSKSVFSVAFSPDGLHLASGSKDLTMRVWNANTGTEIREPIRGHSDTVRTVAYSPDGCRIGSGSWDCTVRIWDAITGDAIGEPLCGHSSRIMSVAYSPDGRYIVSCSQDMTVRVWGANVGDSISETLYGHSSMVRSVAYSRDGQYIVSASLDGTIRIWDARVEDELARQYPEVCAATNSFS
ncbi:WD40-repeat-containing domain protein [Vararia minispora EC-137]|uniref:WD40-repeat-containing domain protein n=1 Tax=Vararia minispora EC-137 TaxID=1314806 RepID=A0ACB8QK84_9AGAM|nr:WD40-repeat-containing domain protein [Vararia minispora EC-137]